MTAPTPSLRDAAQMALDALEIAHDAYAAWGNGTARIDAAIAALRASLALPDAEPVDIIPEGYKLVPLEPTEEIIQAGCLSQQATPEYDNYEDWRNSHSGGIIERIHGYLRKDYRAILAAAPQPAHVERQPLTRHEIHSLLDCAGVKAFGVKFEHEMQVARAVEDAHGIGPASKG